MKRKVVIEVYFKCQKCRCKAMKTAVCVSGVESVVIVPDKNQMEVIGDEVDAANLAIQLRKHVGHAEIITVSAVGEKKP